MNKQPRPSDRQRIPIATALIAAAITLGTGGCSGLAPSTPSSTADASTTAVPATSAPAPASSSPAPASDSPTPAPAQSSPTRLRQVSQAGFATPSGRIVCAMDPGGVRCDYWDYSSPADDRAPHWELPAKPADCALGWGDSLTLNETAQLTCHGDAISSVADINQPVNADNVAWFEPSRDTTTQVNGLTLAVLGYDETLQAGDVLCSSAATGVTCYNSLSGAGFFISRDSYRIF